ncbi:MAG: RNA methyltransferase [Paramuribaculum sp.]|nr:RNA methyltransferase [Paramuribaculum sp.]
MTHQFEMVAKTFQGLEDVLAEELRTLGALNVEPGRRMVSFEGDLAMLYKANMCCRSALRILKPIYKFVAKDADELYDKAKDFDWTKILSLDKTFCIDTVSNSDEFTHSRYVTYRVKDAIVDFFRDKLGPDARPKVRVQNADIMINVHIAGERVTISLDSSGESLHKRGYRVAQTEAPINEVLAAGIILKTGWKGEKPFVDPMCGSGTFLIEAAMIAAGINPGVYRRHFAFESWPDFDEELFDSIYNDDSSERPVTQPIIGADISPKAIAIATDNIKSAGLSKYITLEIKPLSQWNEAPHDGVMVTNPPYGERISADDMDGLYAMIGTKLKHVFQGYHAWIIAYREEYFRKIGLAPSFREPIYNGALECELREYIIFEGEYRTFRREGGSIKSTSRREDKKTPRKSSNKLETKYRSDRKRFSDKKNQSKSFLHHDEKPEITSENPLAARRSLNALKMLQGKMPSLPPSEGPLMRPRRGWKKSSEHTED